MKNIIKFKDVITKDEEKEIADRLKEEYEKISQTASEIESEEHEAENWELTLVEEMSLRISVDLAYMTSERFEEMIDGMDIDIIRKIIRRLRNSYYKTAVRMIQAMFLVNG